jgi:1,4-dihydroxy-2-naphthoate octaprenyltransferase
MKESVLVYLWSIWDNFWWIPVVLLSLLTIIGVGYFFVIMEHRDVLDFYGKNHEKTKYYANLKEKVGKKFKMIGVIAFIVFFVQSFIPSKNQMVMVLSAPYVAKVAKESNASELPIKLIKVLNKSLDYLDKKVSGEK